MSRYDAIIDHPHYQSKTRPHMSMAERAAQFAPFAALTGYDEAIKATNLDVIDTYENPMVRFSENDENGGTDYVP